MTLQTNFKALTMLRAAELTADMKTEHLKKLAALASMAALHSGLVGPRPRAGQQAALSGRRLAAKL